MIQYLKSEVQYVGSWCLVCLKATFTAKKLKIKCIQLIPMRLCTTVKLNLYILDMIWLLLVLQVTWKIFCREYPSTNHTDRLADQWTNRNWKLRFEYDNCEMMSIIRYNDLQHTHTSLQTSIDYGRGLSICSFRFKHNYLKIILVQITVQKQLDIRIPVVKSEKVIDKRMIF